MDLWASPPAVQCWAESRKIWVKSSVLSFAELSLKECYLKHVDIYKRHQHFPFFRTNNTQTNLKQCEGLKSSLFLVLLHFNQPEFHFILVVFSISPPVHLQHHSF